MSMAMEVTAGTITVMAREIKVNGDKDME